MTDNERFENQLAQTKAAKTSEEIRAFAEEGDLELSVEDLDTVSGGGMDWYEMRQAQKRGCPRCGSKGGDEFDISSDNSNSEYDIILICRNCGYVIS